jgi:hypothetical protein
MQRFAVALALTAILGGCARAPLGEPSTSSAIGEHSAVVPDTMAVKQMGDSYLMLALVEMKGEQVPMQVFAADCERKQGSILKAHSLWDAYEKDALLNGPSPKDKVFTQLCNAGLPVARAMQRGVKF